jgi:hypothetical protein
VLGLLAGLALLAFLYGNARHQISTRTAKAAALEAKVQSVQANAGKLAPYTSFVSLREQRVQAVSQLVNARFDWAHAFHELGRVLPLNVSITSLTGTIGSTGTGASAAPAAAPASPPASSAAGAAGAAGAKGSVASSTPPGSVPTFTLGGCARSQSVVALTLERLRLMDGVSGVSLQSSAKGSGGSASGTGSSTSCPASYPVFSVQVVFDALPVSNAKSSPSISSTASTAGATKQSGGQ